MSIYAGNVGSYASKRQNLVEKVNGKKIQACDNR